jgi:hypothetical protein
MDGITYPCGKDIGTDSRMRYLLQWSAQRIQLLLVPPRSLQPDPAKHRFALLRASETLSATI